MLKKRRDPYVDRVNAVIAAMHDQNERAIVKALKKLGKLNVDATLAELVVRIERASAAVDAQQVLNSTPMPTPYEPHVLLAAVQQNDLTAMYKYAQGDFSKLLTSLLVLIAALTYDDTDV